MGNKSLLVKTVFFHMILLTWLLLGFEQSLYGAQDGGWQKPVNPQVAGTVRAFFDKALSEKASYKLLEELCKEIGPRLSGSQGAAQAVIWAKEVMEKEGFDNVYLQNVMVPHWERGEAEEAFVVEAGGKKTALSFLAIGGSVATPPGGITAGVVEVLSLKELATLGEKHIKGKIVFFNQAFDPKNISPGASYGATVHQRTQGAIRAARYGAVGAVIRSLSAAPDDVPHTGTMSYRKGVDSIPHGALGVKSAELLSRKLREGPVKLHMKIHSHWYPDVLSYNVIGEIKGHELPEEVITIGGHLDSWDVGQGAHDDGAGCMHAVGALKLFKDLELNPRRTLRVVLFMNEENGTRGGLKYAETVKSQGEKHLVAIESDAGGFTPRGFGITGSDKQLEKAKSWLPYFNPRTIAFFSKGGGGVDIRPLHDAIGTPMIGLITDGQRTFDYHHSIKDVIENVHPRELELGTASLASLLYLIDCYGF